MAMCAVDHSGTSYLRNAWEFGVFRLRLPTKAANGGPLTQRGNTLQLRAVQAAAIMMLAHRRGSGIVDDKWAEGFNHFI
jgi:hypothetical protein